MADIQDFVTPQGGQDLRVPELPSLNELVKKAGLMDGLREFDRRFKEWRQVLERQLRERISSLTTTEITATANQAVASSQSGIPALTLQIAALEQSLNSLGTLLNSHIAALSAHGTGSNVVGESDGQSLEVGSIIVQTTATINRLFVEIHSEAASGTETGPPTTGTFNTGDIWFDGLLARWRCTTEGFPGDWIQVTPALVVAPDDVVDPPDNYLVQVPTQNWELFFWTGAEWLPVFLTPGIY